jgi:hypothetical protein
VSWQGWEGFTQACTRGERLDDGEGHRHWLRVGVHDERLERRARCYPGLDPIDWASTGDLSKLDNLLGCSTAQVKDVLDAKEVNLAH